MTEAISNIVAFLIIVMVVAWAVFLPAIGLLYVCGFI